MADLRTFGYSYPELNTDWQITDKEKLAAQVKKAVNKLYGSGDDESANGVARREVDEDLNLEDALGEEDDSTVIDGGKEIDENNKITFRRSRSLAKSLSSANSKKPKRQTYGQTPTKNYYYTAELSVDRSEVPLPCTISLIVNEVVMGRMSLLGMPMEGIAKVSMPLARPLNDAVTKNGNGNANANANGGQQQARSLDRKGRLKQREMKRKDVMGRGLGHVDMTPNRIIPFLRGNMTVEIRSVSFLPFYLLHGFFFFTPFPSTSRLFFPIFPLIS